jgi:hypothetical protein
LATHINSIFDCFGRNGMFLTQWKEESQLVWGK